MSAVEVIADDEEESLELDEVDELLDELLEELLELELDEELEDELELS